MSYIDRTISVLRKDGFFALLKKGVPFVYNRHIAPLLPRTNAEYNGVNVNAARYFDSILPWRDKDRPDYESGLVSGLEERAKEGDDIVLVGGGWGVTAVKAAQMVGPSGKVTVYEGSIEEVRHVNETATLNNIQSRIEVIHGIVGPEISLRGEQGDAEHITPDELPDCDILELDCEGSEIEILENLSIRPRMILVESHGMNDAPSSEVETILENLSYSVESKQVADQGIADFCEKHDIYTLVAVRE